MQLHIGTPSKPQADFLRASTRFVAYGGARGGGKSWAVRKKALLLALRYHGIKILILRRTYPELRENHILPMMGDVAGVGTYRDSDKSITFATGSRLKFGYCDTDADVLQYQGQEFDVIFIDEATQLSEYHFTALTACLRGANDFPKRFYLTCNPGGVGHGWVKRLFIDRDYRPGEDPDDYTFIRARVYDNAALMDNDPDYLRGLQALPDDMRRAWLDGDWDVYAGQYFPEFSRELHVCDPHPIPDHWRRYVALDYGLDMLACYWFAIDTQGRATVYREVYRSGLIVSDAAAAILTANGTDSIDAWHAPPDLWGRRQDTGKTAAEIMAESGLLLQKAPNDRVNGWYAVKEWLRPTAAEDGSATANLQIFSSCTNLIRTLPLLQHDHKRPGDAATEPHEITHAPDALRYFCAGRPIPATVPVEPDEDYISHDDQIGSFLGYRG